MSGWVTSTGPPRRIWSRKVGITEPLEPSTLPKRVVMNWVAVCASDRLWQYISQMRLEHPMTLVGLTALSVEIMTNLPTP